MAVWNASEIEMKRELVALAQAPGVNRRELARRFKASPTTLYRLLERARAEGVEGLQPRSRRPKTSPSRTLASLEAAVLALRAAHPSWGGRKLHHALKARGLVPPAPSTITEILRRNGFPVGRPEAAPARSRFERAAPNELWQMDFKGHVPMGSDRLHPLTVLDDHSRYALVLAACTDERGATVKPLLTAAFERFGRPWTMLVDNGPPWGDGGRSAFTAFALWLIEHDIAVTHARPRHPQTLGKDERFHRTLKAEALGTEFPDPAAAQAALDAFRNAYNHERPHEALGHSTPASRYAPSPRAWSERVEPFDYGPDDQLRRVCTSGRISFAGRIWRVGHAFAGKSVAVRPSAEDGRHDIVFRVARIGAIDLRALAG
jgi:transposase InsO family protein